MDLPPQPLPLWILLHPQGFSGAPNAVTIESGPSFFPGAKAGELSDWRWLATPPHQSQAGLKARIPTHLSTPM